MHYYASNVKFCVFGLSLFGRLCGHFYMEMKTPFFWLSYIPLGCNDPKKITTVNACFAFCMVWALGVCARRKEQWKRQFNSIKWPLLSDGIESCILAPAMPLAVYLFPFVLKMLETMCRLNKCMWWILVLLHVTVNVYILYVFAWRCVFFLFFLPIFLFVRSSAMKVNC